MNKRRSCAQATKSISDQGQALNSYSVRSCSGFTALHSRPYARLSSIGSVLPLVLAARLLQSGTLEQHHEGNSEHVKVAVAPLKLHRFWLSPNEKHGSRRMARDNCEVTRKFIESFLVSSLFHLNFYSCFLFKINAILREVTLLLEVL